jgi:glycosyltransferase involved in cell wall biosynthesis
MQHASGLIQASIAEGFGLPVAEAGALGVPLLLSDIAVFHEVAGAAAAYFPVSDSARLAQLLEQALSRGTAVPFRTWQAASAEMARVILGTA